MSVFLEYLDEDGKLINGPTDNNTRVGDLITIHKFPGTTETYRVVMRKWAATLRLGDYILTVYLEKVEE